MEAKKELYFALVKYGIYLPAYQLKIAVKLEEEGYSNKTLALHFAKYTDQTKGHYSTNDARQDWIKNCSKKVAKINPSNGAVVQVYDSINKASKDVEVTQSAITHVLKTKGLCKGFKWALV